MERRMYAGLQVDYYDVDELYVMDPETNYMIVRTRPEDTKRIMELESIGFTFHDRTFLCEISPQKLDPNFVKLIRAEVKMDFAFSDDIYDLANQTFITDRRFHLKKEFDQKFAGRIIEEYINDLKKSGCFWFKSFHRGQLTGFTFVRPYSNIICENMLGAVSKEYQNKGVAFQLYAFMVNSLREMGYRSLYGRISTSNIPSINLHIMLGGKFSKVKDEYIFRKSDV